GDIQPGVKALPWIKEYFSEKQVIYVLGNHEFYGQAIPKHSHKLKELVQGSNIYVLENDCLLLGDVVFLGCTLWTDFKLFGDPRVAGFYATESMNDYKKIRVSPDYRKLRSLDTAGLHFRSRTWLADQFEVYRGRKIVVVTHHLPSARSLPEGYADDILNAAYASHMDAYVEKSSAKLWIHGHKHRSQDYFIGNTRVICNPRGYPEKPNPGFSPGLVVEV
ncbi:MAG TPA: metallophosphoesterase, partial [Anaerolineales bacterium]|nr:metallophosphoesterase [Anaerolineales bacterium]